MRKLLLMLALGAILSAEAIAQNANLTKEKVLSMSVDELSELPLEDLMHAVELLEVKSVDELFALVMNKNVSSASKKAEDSFKTPLSTSVLTREEIRTFGCTSVEEALRMMTGMIVREKNNGNYDVHVRGLDNIPDANMILYAENVNTLLMINSRPVYNYATGATMWEQLPVSIEDIERIEIVRGPSSALYGSNAVTGVINIITEKPTVDSKLVQGVVQAGNLGTYIGEAAVRKAFSDKLAASVSFNFQQRNRLNDKVFVLPNWGIYDPNDPNTDYNVGQWVDVQKLYDLRVGSGDGREAKLSERSSVISEAFTHPELARRTIGANAAVSFNPSSDVSLDITGGYQKAEVTQTTEGSDYWPFNERETEIFYFDITSSIKGVNFQANYSAGPQNHMIGTPGFKVDANQFTVNLDYDWSITPQLSVRPGINYRWNQVDDKKYSDNYSVNKFGEQVKLSSVFNGVATLRALAPNLRIDYSPIEQLRFIAAYRAEKLNLPDDIYHSWQLAATFSPRENHNLRLIYSRANRSANFINTSSNYNIVRVDYPFPDEIEFKGSPEAKVMVADNFELGYRLRPNSKVLIDVEAFYTHSRDYGALSSHSANLFMTTDNFLSILQQIGGSLMQVQAGLLPIEQLPNQITTIATAPTITKAYVHYQNLPYKVNQFGASLSLDWILTNKLILKANLNVQKTTIDDYYAYHKHIDIAEQFAKATEHFSGALNEFTQMMADPTKLSWLQPDNLLNGKKECHVYRDEYNQTLDVHGGRTEASDKYLQRFFDEENFLTYFGLKYGCETNEDFTYVTIGRSMAHEPHTPQKNYKHKNTPTFYGSVGLLYKPMEKLSVASHAYFYTKQTQVTENGINGVSPKCIVNLKVGYKPIEQLEVFFNAHNLFNDKKVEFANTDPMRGIYSVGLNFGL